MMIKVKDKPFPIQIDESVAGTVTSWMMCEKGVYYVYVQNMNPTENAIFNCDWIYIVEESCPLAIIPENVRTYGYKADNLYYFDFIDGSCDIIAYEIALYRLRQKKRRSPSKIRSLVDEAESCYRTGSTICPSFFGAPIPPNETPWGPVCRCLTVDTGMWFLQTSIHTGGIWVFSVCGILAFDVNDIVRNTGVTMTGTPGLFNIEPVFWTMDKCAPAIWEYLYHLEITNLGDFIISREAIQGFIALNNTEYAEWSNSLLTDAIKESNEWITEIDHKLSMYPLDPDDESELRNCKKIKLGYLDNSNESELRNFRESKLRYIDNLTADLFHKPSSPITEFLKPL